MSIDALTHYTALNSDTVKETQIQVETLSSKKKILYPGEKGGERRHIWYTLMCFCMVKLKGYYSHQFYDIIGGKGRAYNYLTQVEFTASSKYNSNTYYTCFLGSKYELA